MESIIKFEFNFTESSFQNLLSTDANYRAIGSRRDALYIVLPVTVIYLSIFLTGTIGNVSTCIVIARNKSMHTATNYYLFSLAVSDLLLLISGLPAEVYLVWSKYPYIFGKGFCILRGLAAECSTNASVLTITAFTIERYVAICHPFLSHTLSKLSLAIKFILIIWLISLCFAIPQALQFGIVEYPHISPDLIVCTLKTFVIKHSFELSTLFFFIVPMTLIIILYSMIGLQLRKSNMLKKRNLINQGIRKIDSRNKNWENRHSTGKSSRRILKMLVAIVVAFFICWAPFHVQRLIAIHGTGSDRITSKSKWMEFLYILFTYISGVLYYFSTTINPILYNIMSNKFRRAFIETLARRCVGTKPSLRKEPKFYSNLSRSKQKTADNFVFRVTKRESVIGPNSLEVSEPLEAENKQTTFTSEYAEVQTVCSNHSPSMTSPNGKAICSNTNQAVNNSEVNTNLMITRNSEDVFVYTQ